MSSFWIALASCSHSRKTGLATAWPGRGKLSDSGVKMVTGIEPAG